MFLCNTPTFVLPVNRRVESLAVSADGKWALVGDSIGTAQLWDLRNSQRELKDRQATLQVTHGEAVSAVAFAGDGRYFATAGKSGFIRIWDTELLRDGNTTHTQVEAHPGSTIHSLEFSRSAGQLVSASGDMSARVWSVKWEDPPVIEQSHELLRHGGAVWDARFSDDGEQVVTAGDDRLAIMWTIDGSASKQPDPDKIFYGHNAPVYAATFSPDGLRVASVGRDQNIFLWRPNEQKKYDYTKLKEPEIKAVVLSGHLAAIRDVQFAGSAGDVLVTAGDDNTIRIWDASDPSDKNDSSKLRLKLRQRAGFKDPSVSSDDVDDGAVARAVPTAERALQILRGHGGWVHTARLPTEGTMIVSAGYDTEAPVKVWHPLEYAEQRVLREHTGGVLHTEFSPSGRYLVTTGADYVSRIWDVESGKELASLDEGHEFMTMRAQIATGKMPRLVSVGADNTLRIWDADRGGQLKMIGDTGTSGALAISHGGDLILSGGPNNSALLIDAADGTIVQRLEGHQGVISAVGFSSDDKQLATCDSKGRGRLWQRDKAGEAWRLHHELVGHAAGREITAVSFLPDGNRLLTASADNTVVQWDTTTGEELPNRLLRHEEAVTSMALSPDGRQVVTVTAIGERKTRQTDNGDEQPVGRDQQLWLWDVDRAEVMQTHPVHDQYITHVEFSLRGDAVLVAASDSNTTDNYVRQWKPATDEYGPFWPTEGGRGSIWSASYTPKGFTPSGIVTAGGTRIRIWDETSGEQLQEYGRDGAVAWASFSPDDRFVVTTDRNRSVKIWDRETKHVVRRLNNPHSGQPVSYARFLPPSAPGRFRLLTAGGDNTSRIWDMDENFDGVEGQIESEPFVLPSTEESASPPSVAVTTVSPDGTQLVVISDDGVVHVWDIDSHTLTIQRNLETTNVTSVAMASNGKYLICGSLNNTAKVWDLTAPSMPLVLRGHSAPLTAVGFSPDGRRALTTSRDGTAKVWAQPDDLDSFDSVEMLTLKGHDSELTTGQFSPDGRYIVTGNGDRSGTDSGVAIVWLTQLIHPSLDVANDAIELDEETSRKRVMADVAVREPMRARFANSTLSIDLSKPTTEAYQGRLKIDFSGLIRDEMIWVPGGPTMSERAAGIVTDLRSDYLRIELDQRVSGEEIEAILSRLTIERVTGDAADSPVIKEGTVDVRSQLSGSDANEQMWSTNVVVKVQVLPVILNANDETAVAIK